MLYYLQILKKCGLTELLKGNQYRKGGTLL